MQNKTDKGTSLVSKSLPVANLNSVNHLFSATKTNDYVLEYERKFRESLNNIAQTLNVEQIVYLWNEGIELNTLDNEDLYIYKEVLAIHDVTVSEIEDSTAIDNRLKVKYDVENNLIRCIE